MAITSMANSIPKVLQARTTFPTVAQAALHGQMLQANSVSSAATFSPAQFSACTMISGNMIFLLICIPGLRATLHSPLNLCTARWELPMQITDQARGEVAPPGPTMQVIYGSSEEIYATASQVLLQRP